MGTHSMKSNTKLLRTQNISENQISHTQYFVFLMGQCLEVYCPYVKKIDNYLCCQIHSSHYFFSKHTFKQFFNVQSLFSTTLKACNLVFFVHVNTFLMRKSYSDTYIVVKMKFKIIYTTEIFE